MNLGPRLGLAVYYKNKGEVWLAPVRQWILPALGGSAALKYLGLRSSEAVALMVGVALVWEVAAVLIGWLEHRTGATRAHYQAAADTDPFRRESLELLRDIKASHEATFNLVLWFYERARL
jgi:hypothetical protein